MQSVDLVPAVTGDDFEALVPAHEAPAGVEHVAEPGQAPETGGGQRPLALLSLGDQQALGHVSGHAQHRCLLPVAEQVGVGLEPAQRPPQASHPVLDPPGLARQHRAQRLSKAIAVVREHQRGQLSPGQRLDVRGLEQPQPRVVDLDDAAFTRQHQHRLRFGAQHGLELRVPDRELEVRRLERHHLLLQLASQDQPVGLARAMAPQHRGARWQRRRHGGQHLFQPRDELLGLRGLDDECIRAQVPNHSFVGLVGVGGGVHHEGHAAESRIALPLSQELEAVFDRHQQIRDAKLGWVRPGLRQRLVAVRRFLDLEARRAEQRAQQVAIRLQVVDHQHAGHCTPRDGKNRSTSVTNVSGSMGFSM